MLITKNILSKVLNREKLVRIFIPENTEGPYEVLYMYDGQNLFNTKTSAYGDIWDMDTQVPRLIKAGIIKPIMVVGIDSSEQRLDEYSPFNNNGIYKFMPKDNRVSFYGHLVNKFIVDELIPYINKNFQTLPDKTHIAGSSLGGLMALHASINYPNTFKGIGIFSLAAYFNPKGYKSMLKDLNLNPNQKYFITVGTNESNHTNDKLNKAYLRDSLYLYETVKPLTNTSLEIINNAIHTESFWASQVPNFLKYISTK